MSARSVVAVVGSLAHDTIDGEARRAGGCPVFAADAFRLLGRGGRILARSAEADIASFAAELAAANVEVEILPSPVTTAFEHEHRDGQRESRVTALGDAWGPADAGRLGAAVGWVHVAPLTRSDFGPATLAAFAAGGRRLSLDGQGLVRVPGLGPLVQDAAFDPAVLDPVSVLKLSEEEARVIAGGVFDAASARALGVAEVVETLGERGVTMWVDGSPTAVPASPVTGVETTGAGDAFMVAYAIARLDGTPPVAAAEAACALVTIMLRRRRDAAGETVTA